MYILRQFPLHDQNRPDLPAEKTVKSEKYIFFFFAVITKAAVVLPKYYVTSQLTILQPKQSYVCSASFGVDQTTPVRSHTNPLHTLISFLIYNHFNIISSYNYV